jgi:hypothetical protein
MTARYSQACERSLEFTSNFADGIFCIHYEALSSNSISSNPMKAMKQ